jgi:hypothetical protein
MPAKAYSLLQEYIKDTLDALQGSKSLPSFISGPLSHRSSIIKVLKEWQEEAAAKYPAQRIREATLDAQMPDSSTGMGPGTGPWSRTSGWEKEQDFHSHTAILALPSPYDQIYEEEMRECFTQFDSRRPDEALLERAERIADQHWKPNVTAIDLDFHRSLDPSDPDREISIMYDPSQFGKSLQEMESQPENPRGLISYAGHWFGRVALALHKIKSKLHIEVMCGDVNAILDQMRYDLADNAGSANGEPRLFDRIYLSNIPDYVGGSLSTYLHAIPLLHTAGRASWVTANCLRNPGTWSGGAEQFDYEYTGLHATTDLAKVFGVRGGEARQPARGGFFDDMDPPLKDYRRWFRVPLSGQFYDLVPRDELETWLYNVFLKLAIPISAGGEQTRTVFKPLNLTAFLRVCMHLKEAGYPAHWLSDVLSHIVSGRIVPEARARRTDPAKVSDAAITYPKNAQFIAPFVAEMTTLVAICQPALRFGVLSTAIPSLSSIRRFEVSFRTLPAQGNVYPHFVLLFFNHSIMRPHTGYFRPYILDDETCETSRSTRRLQKEGLHLLSVWQWKQESKTASFWLREDVMARVKRFEQDWKVAIWRTGSWQKWSEWRPAIDVAEVGSWLD